ncbi:sigma-54 dependent transcriptional regulator [Thermithiobacillus plumbiphilus]|uniref:Sigma-54 dependent transcriptional regulator n=1 Tax=Thermithiobacillus plumbiphilus TaxID=1729899 RepID=A0ABU9DAM0_9PROT
MTEKLKILVVEDDADLREALQDTLALAGHQALACPDGLRALSLLEVEAVDLVLSDVRMQPMNGYVLLDEIRRRHPHLPILLMTAYGTVQEAVAALQHGACDYLVKPFDAQLLLEKIHRYALRWRPDSDMVAEDARMQELAALAGRVAATDASVMISGESGTGKEVLARHIHQHSPRREQAFVAINCAAIPENLLEATLFGYEKGAFTGATQAMPGKFEQAQHGTLLLDEVTEMPLGLQAKLLRVLQEREVERLGARKPIALDVRILATSNRDLAQAVRAGQFREDLYYRLNVFPLELPPLRERPADILPLAQRFLHKWSGLRGGQINGFAPAALRQLLAYTWPGNVRELENVIQRAVILSSGATVEADAILLSGTPARLDALPAQAPASAPIIEDAEVLEAGLRQQERSLILAALQEAGGSRKEAAERLGISPRTLRHKLQRYREQGDPLPAE